MKKKCFIIMLFSISLVVAVFASKRMSVNEIISENVEALSFDDLGNGYVGIKWPEQRHITPLSWGNDWNGFTKTPDHNDTWNKLPKCTGEKKTCNRPTDEWCWAYYVIPEDYFMYLLSQGYYFLLIP